MKTFLLIIGGCLSVRFLLAQPTPSGSKSVMTFQSPATHLNTTSFFPATPAQTVVSRIDWTSDIEADQTVSAPTFIAKACITSAKPVLRYSLLLNDKVQTQVRDLKVERDKDCQQVFNQTVQLNEGENKLRLTAYLNGGGEVTSNLTVIYKKPPVLVLEKRLALVIGNSDYVGSNKLTNPVNDANDVATALKKLGFEVLQFANLNNKSMRQAINNFGEKLRDYQVGLFYYAGHGVQNNGNNYLVPTDAQPESKNEIEYECIDANRILTKMEDARTRTNIVVLDACRNNPLDRSWSRGGDNTGLASMDAPIGSVIAYATAPGKTAADGNGRNGLYTAALLKALQTPNQTIIQLFQQVRSEVVRQSDRKQVPWESTSLTGDFYFQRK
ncbi:caspase family protein [Spirosoma sp. RP8]|uniref:Caspase family protein n=1 Tax=Spirosoma liriopis TaxID=2937440 RepID=A0ABT0HM16_9BACT|nr:caspase family protein [Spirosoma liriopis]MCK8493215.1 caspase family protein [Spirosoma liriopis]